MRTVVSLLIVGLVSLVTCHAFADETARAPQAAGTNTPKKDSLKSDDLDDLTVALNILRAVKREGAGNAAARTAWPTVAGADVKRLPTILSALDDASPLALNWLRSAIEAIAERETRTGRGLSVADLEAFVLDTSHGPRSRRLAFELLTRIDPQAENRLVPGFLNDPSLELRREAVARLINTGERLSAEAKEQPDKKPVAIETLRRAFASSRDLDQIAELAKSLKSLGETVDLPQHFGFIMTWRLIGPFDNRDFVGYNTVYGPEKDFDTTSSYVGKEQQSLNWIEHTTTDPHGMVDLNKALGKDMGAIAYAAAEFNSDTERKVDFRIGCICACKLWVNGQLIDQHEVYHSGTKIDQYISQASLKPGRNQILVKICQNEQTEKWAQDWQFQLRVCDAIGTAILSAK